MRCLRDYGGHTFDCAFVFADDAKGVVEAMTKFPFLPLDRPIGPAVTKDTFPMAGRAADDELGQTNWLREGLATRSGGR